MNQKDELKRQAYELLEKSGFSLTHSELSSMEANDFGLDNFEEEGFFLIDLLRTDRVRVNLLILLPNQSLPQHLHPSYEDEEGKEETLRVLYGETKVYVEGDENNPEIRIPENKEPFYTSRHEIHLKLGEQYSVSPNTKHWFQAGPNGSVNIAFQNRVNEDHNVFYDPESAGCKISNENLN
jgi:D-lyxose ketol-isomerase